MKQLSKTALLIVLFAAIVMPMKGQVSTEGRDFWVALTYSTAPKGATTARELYLAVSAREDCKVSITNPNTDWAGIKDLSIPAGTWKEIKEDLIPYTQWWPGKDKGDVNGKTMGKGLHVTSDKDISLFAAIRYEYSFDASMVLPTHVLQKEYIVQDYPPYDHEDKTSWSTYSILATADGTTNVAITPLGAATATTIQLTKGMVYYFVSNDKQSVSGTHILADQPIAVFNGDVCTDVPGEISARDLTYEQAMPVDYWGTEFVVTRSLYKDANRIRITAQENETDIFVDGTKVATIDARQTYECELSEGTANLEKVTKELTENGLAVPDVFNGVAHYIKTSCPCAVYSYEVSEKYTNTYDSKSTLPTEVLTGINKEGKEHNLGDPSMVWISPLEQRIKHLTFGVCPTDNVTLHNINIVVLTADVDNVVLSSKSNKTIPLTFKSLAGTKYSYARQQICNSETNDDRVFTLSCPSGFIAHIYGNGMQESYAYSAGSSAVSLGMITIGDQVFENGTVSQTPLCIDEDLTFDASAGTIIIDKIDWDFDDGTRETSTESSTTHRYTSPGWYNVTANLSAHKECPDITYPPMPVTFRFRVVRPDTIVAGARRNCFTLEEYKNNPDSCDALIATGGIETEQEHCYDNVKLYRVVYGLETEETKDTLTNTDEVKGYNGKYYSTSQDVIDTIKNDAGCPHYVHYYVRVITCLGMQISDDSIHLCPGDDLTLRYSKSKGDIKGNYARFVVPEVGLDKEVRISNDNTDAALTIDTRSITKPGRYYGQLIIPETYTTLCGDTLRLDVPFTVNYPDSIFAYKFNNVLTVYNTSKTGYTFTGYQWFLNGDSIPGANESILHIDSTFHVGDVVYVELTDANGMILPSCSQTIEVVPDYHPEPAAEAPAQKLIYRQRIVIRKGEMLYDLYGQRIQ